MPQVIDAEDWPNDERPRTIAYFCGTLDTPAGGRTAITSPEYAATPCSSSSATSPACCPASRSTAPCGGTCCAVPMGASGADALRTQHVVANVDPSDRYVQSPAGTDRYRLRPDESGYENLVLAGDWTDCGLNAGCIEAAVMSGLQAANAVLGRSQFHRIAGLYLP